VALGVLIWVLVIGGWMVLTDGGYVPAMFLPAPGKVLATAGKLISDGTLLVHTLSSAQVVLIGFVVSSVVAVPLGLYMGTYKAVQAGLDPLVNFIRYLPVTSFVPLFILWIGIGIEQRVAVIVFGVFFAVCSPRPGERRLYARHQTLHHRPPYRLSGHPARRAGYSAGDGGLGLDLSCGGRTRRRQVGLGVYLTKGHARLSGGCDLSGHRHDRDFGPDHRPRLSASPPRRCTLGPVNDHIRRYKDH
jgi:hypothetical protein